MKLMRHLILLVLFLSAPPAATAAHVRFSIPHIAPLATTVVVRAINQSLPAVHITAAGRNLSIRIDTAKLPHSTPAVEKSTRTFTAIVTPAATAAQAKTCGLFLPDKLDPAKPVVIVIHGVDMERADMADVAKPLADSGLQVGYFQYLPDQPIADDVAALTTAMKDLRQKSPALKIDLVAYSMGGLVARGYVEGDGYAGGVDRLILLATPNHGSDWAPLMWITKTEQQIDQAQHDPTWRPSWAITGGLCEAARDIKQGSPFLTALNARPRRAGVTYTIIAGDCSPVRRVVAAAVAAPQALVPSHVRSALWYRLARFGVTAAATEVADPDRDCDGPVKLTSAMLDGVTDFVVVHADHQSMIHPRDGNTAPVAAVLLARLK
jgi:pimeloyl-ACP methyl ester carboxylesterase